MYKYIALLFICTALQTGCSNVKPYNYNAQSNLFITSKIDPDVKSAIDIYHVNNSCEPGYKGTVSLDRQKISLALENNQPHYLLISFSSSSFWTGRSSSMSRDMLLIPSANNHYLLNVSYIDDIYNVELKEKNLRSKKVTTVETKHLNACTSK